MPAVPERQALDRSPPASSPLRLPVEDLNDTDSSALDEDHVDVEAPSSAEEGAHFGQSLQIDMKTLVGDAVGNISISPSSRDLVLAARRGLFIIDLEAPLEVPRFLPQGGTWDVADVQWSPHVARSEYVVSTSSEKLLIWNLMLQGKTSIQHVLHSHYRAITDINWHTSEYDTVISTGIDSWLWAWDLRQPRKPSIGLCAFHGNPAGGGTHVKWNRHDPNVIASAHTNEVLIWDRRNGSLPTARIPAHRSKIYGLDWSHTARNELVTCSLDRTIKFWDINCLSDTPGVQSSEAKATIHTSYPVWRARNLPFGEGVMSLPQRGETALELYGRDNLEMPIERFEGHTDVVKEFVWRNGEQDDFQLITWSKDRTLRFWPVDHETLQSVGHVFGENRGRTGKRPSLDVQSYRDVSFRGPTETTPQSMLSAPIGNRSILAEVRALPPSMTTTSAPVVLGGEKPTSAHARLSNTRTSNTRHVPIPHTIASLKKTGTMSKGSVTGKSVATQMDAFTWLSKVRVGGRRGSSSGRGSDVSPSGSQSRPASAVRGRSINRIESDSEEEKEEQSLADEILSVVKKLSEHKIKLEKADLTKKRTCTLGLHGPWGEKSSVFLRVTFTFPKDYPHAQHPGGTPSVEVERSPLISMKDYVFILRRLRTIRQHRRPCLEACLRFLLFAREDEHARGPLYPDSESSSDEDEAGKSRDVTVSLLRNNKNLTEPRTLQGAFGPNGELVCFFRAPPRIVRTLMPDVSGSPDEPGKVTPKLFKHPALIFDAVDRLSSFTPERPTKSDPRRHGDTIARIMTNLLTFSPLQYRPELASHAEDQPQSYVLPMRRSTIAVTNTMGLAGPERKVAVDYVFLGESLEEVCRVNAGAARVHGRYDHQRVFEALAALFPALEDENGPHRYKKMSAAQQVVMKYFEDFCVAKDVQMLGMLSSVILQAFDHHQVGAIQPKSPVTATHTRRSTPLSANIANLDYFTTRRSRTSPHSPPWHRSGNDSPSRNFINAAISSSNSSRGSWSSLFNTGTMRQYLAGVQDTLREGLATPSTETLPPTPKLPPTPTTPLTPRPTIPVPASKVLRGPDSPIPRARRPRQNSILAPLNEPMSKSWNESFFGSNPGPSPPVVQSSYSSAGSGNNRVGQRSRRPTFSRVPPPRTVTTVTEKRLVFKEEMMLAEGR
ncbi:WD40 repeat-like protein [Schizophyllum commune Loenen D]|nr:WD40 repeat-like protein [Schizophyllum commune Loenen D]